MRRSLVLIFTAVFGVVSIAFAISEFRQEEAKNNEVVVEVWSDVICPYCFLGKRKLERAIEKLGAKERVKVVWKAFQLSPNFPVDSALSSFTYLTEHRGYPEDRLKRSIQALVDAGQPYGIEFNFDRALTYNTLKAHRLIQWASTQEKGSALKDALMEAYFTAGKDLSHEDQLLQVVEATGLDKQEASTVLAGNQYLAEVKEHIRRAGQIGVSGVPFFLINGEKQISGAQDDRVFESALEKALGH